MDEEKTENAAEDDYTAAGDNIEPQENVAHRAGNDANRGSEYVRQGFCSNHGVSARGREESVNAARIVHCLTADYTDYLMIVVKAARMAGS